MDRRDLSELYKGKREKTQLVFVLYILTKIK